MQITENKDTISKVNRNQFDYYKISDIKEVPQTREKKQREILNILSAVFVDNLQWIFFRNGVRIHANILDETFLKDVIRGGESFTSGDKLDAMLNIIQEYDKTSGTYIDKKYFVTKIYKHIKRTETPPLFG